MGKNIIVSEQTVRDLLEAHASLSAWYYELWTALRAAGATSRSPDDAVRAAFVERLVTDFPELAAVARQITVPRMYVPAPATLPGRPPGANEEAETLIEPAPKRSRDSSTSLPAAAGAVTPPPVVKPNDVKY